MADRTDSRKRWDTDDRFAGVADAGVFAAAIEELAALARRPGWVAEEPEVHLVPRLRGAGVEEVRLPDCRAGDDGVLDIVAEYSPGDSRRDIRWPGMGAAWGHSRTHGRRARAPRRRHRRVFEVVTGVPEGSGHFASHGHTLRLILLPATAPWVACGQHPHPPLSSSARW
jgi:hypothetical protein